MWKNNLGLQDSLTTAEKLPLPKIEKNQIHIQEEVRQIHEEERRIRTSLDLPKSLHHKLKIKCAQSNISIKEFCEMLVRENV